MRKPVTVSLIALMVIAYLLTSPLTAAADTSLGVAADEDARLEAAEDLVLEPAGKGGWVETQPIRDKYIIDWHTGQLVRIEHYASAPTHPYSSDCIRHRTTNRNYDDYQALRSCYFGIEGQIDRAYLGVFGELRYADRGGFEFWRNLRLAGMTELEMLEHFIASAEYRARFGAPSTEERVDRMYFNILQRLPDPGGRQFWIDQIRHHGMSEAEVMQGFINSVENLGRRWTDWVIRQHELNSGWDAYRLYLTSITDFVGGCANVPVGVACVIPDIQDPVHDEHDHDMPLP